VWARFGGFWLGLGAVGPVGVLRFGFVAYKACQFESIAMQLCSLCSSNRLLLCF
jgi:hypothetical protein